MTKLKQWLTAGLAALLGVLSIVFYFTRKRNNELELELTQKDLEIKDGDLKHKEDSVDKAITEKKKELSEVKKQEAAELTPEEIEKHWSKK